MTVLYGVATSLLVGSADFYGGRVTRRAGALATTNAAFAAGIVTAVALAVLLGHELGARDLFLGGLSGLAAAAALVSFYAAFGVAPVGVVAPATSVVTAAGPVLVDLVGGARPEGLVIAGMVLGVGSLFLTTWTPESTGDRRRGVLLGVAAGVSFAAAVSITAETSVASGIWPLAAQRAVATLAVTALCLTRGVALVPPGAGDRRLAAVSGVIATAGLACLVLGVQRGPLGPVAVAGSLFPVVTIALNWRFAGEHLRWWQVLGVVTAFVGVAAIVVG